MNYKTLKVGDVRQQGDEVKALCVGIWSGHWIKDGWRPVTLVGWPILPSDLVNAEFRRPV